MGGSRDGSVGDPCHAYCLKSLSETCDQQLHCVSSACSLSAVNRHLLFHLILRPVHIIVQVLFVKITSPVLVSIPIMFVVGV